MKVLGNHVAVVRTFDRQNRPIQADELHSFVQTHYGFEIAKRTSRKGEHMLVLMRSGEETSRCELEFDDQAGELWMKNPEPTDIDIMLEIAGALGGRVRNDDLETFRTPTEVYVHADDQAAHDAAWAITRDFLQKKRRTDRIWWMLRVGGLLIFILGVLATWLGK